MTSILLVVVLLLIATNVIISNDGKFVSIDGGPVPTLQDETLTMVLGNRRQYQSVRGLADNVLFTLNQFDRQRPRKIYGAWKSWKNTTDGPDCDERRSISILGATLFRENTDANGKEDYKRQLTMEILVHINLVASCNDEMKLQEYFQEQMDFNLAITFTDLITYERYPMVANPCYVNPIGKSTLYVMLICDWCPLWREYHAISAVNAGQKYAATIQLKEQQSDIDEYFELEATHHSDQPPAYKLPSDPVLTFDNKRQSTNKIHNIVGCSRVLSNVDLLEEKSPGLVHTWLLHHLFVIKFGHISIYDTDGSAEKFLLPFIRLNLVRYYPYFFSKKDYDEIRDDVAFNHCTWSSHGISEWSLRMNDWDTFFFFASTFNPQNTLSHLATLHPSNFSHVYLLHCYISHSDDTIRSPSPLVDHHLSKLMISESLAFYRFTEGKAGDLESIFTVRSRDLQLIDNFHKSDVFNLNGQMMQDFLRVWKVLLLNYYDSFINQCQQLKILNHVVSNSHSFLRSNAKYPLPVENTKSLKFVFISPGSLSIPPKGWGAVEIILWHYYLELTKVGHQVHVFNGNNRSQILNEIELMKPDVVHIHADIYFYLVDVISKFSKVILLTGHDAFGEPFRWSLALQQSHDSLIVSKARCQKSVYFFALTQKQAEFTRYYLDFPDTHVHWNPNGVELSQFRFTSTPSLAHKTICVGRIILRKRQHFLQEYLNEDEIDFAGTIDYKGFNYNASNFLGEWTKQDLYQNLTEYGNLVLLSDAEAAPLVVLEALAAGLGLVITPFAAANLDINLPFISVIPLNLLTDREYIRAAVENNRIVSLSMREEIRKYAESFSWSQKIIPHYLHTVENILQKAKEDDFHNYQTNNALHEISNENKQGLATIIHNFTSAKELTADLVKWINYHLSLGISHIFIAFTQGNGAEIEKVLLRMVSKDAVTIVHSEQALPLHCSLDKFNFDKFYHKICLRKVMVHAQVQFRMSYIDWMLLLSHHEFVIMKKQLPGENHLVGLLEQVEESYDLLMIDRLPTLPSNNAFTIFYDSDDGVDKLTCGITRTTSVLYESINMVYTTSKKNPLPRFADPNIIVIGNATDLL